MHQILNKKNGSKALDILLLCEDKLTISLKLPKNISIAHKTGTLDIVRGDSAIIFRKTLWFYPSLLKTLKVWGKQN